MIGIDVLLAMLPEHLLLLGMLALIGMAVAGRGERAALWVAILSVAAAALAAAVLSVQGYSAAPFAGQFSVDPPALLAKAMVLALALPVLAMSREQFSGGEFALLLLSSLYGVCLMQSADSFLTLFLGLETMSLPVYALVVLARGRAESAEAALKYLVLGGTATATFLMGVSLLYGSSGSMGTHTFATALAALEPQSLAAVVLVLLSFYLKAAVVPFHAWAPDAYEGSSVPVTAYMAVIVKAGVLLAVVRLFGNAVPASPVFELIVVLPLASVVWGNLAAMRQPSLRRMIGYSSIAHAGYLFLALLGAPEGRLQAVAFYILAYGLLNLLAFAVLPAAGGDRDRDRDRLDRLKGLYTRAPFAALALALAMLSLAGIPPLPGFVAKFLIFKNLIDAGHTLVAVLGLVGSYLGIYFYLRVMQLMFMSPDSGVSAPPPRGLVLGASLACLAATLLLVVFPGAVIARL